MGIESDAKKDLTLGKDAAEDVMGGMARSVRSLRSKFSKKHAHHAAVPHGAPAGIIINEPPEDPSQVHANDTTPLSDDPDR